MRSLEEIADETFEEIKAQIDLTRFDSLVDSGDIQPLQRKAIFALEYDTETGEVVRQPAPTAEAPDPIWLDTLNPPFGTKSDSQPYHQEKTLTDLFNEYSTVDDKVLALELQISALKDALVPLQMVRTEIQQDIDAQLKRQGMEKGTFMGYAYKYTKSTETIIEDEEQVPETFWKQKPYIDKDLLKKTFALTKEPIPGVLILNKQNLSLRQLADK